MNKAISSIKMTLRIPPDLHTRLGIAAKHSRLSMADFILTATQKEVEVVEDLMKFENAAYEKFTVPCQKCNATISLSELRKRNAICPKCGERVRMLKAKK